MFKNLHASFLEAIDNFKYELRKEPTFENSLDLTNEMQEKIKDARKLIGQLRSDIRQCLNQTEKEAGEIATCRRRKRLALDVDDDETARLADEYLVKHQRNRIIYEQKTAVLKDELLMREDELQLMFDMLNEVGQKNRDSRPSNSTAESLHTGKEESDENLADFESQEGKTFQHRILDE